MLWGPNHVYQNEPFELEEDLEAAILEVREALFGELRIYLNLKKKIGAKGKISNVPDGYLIDLSSKKEPKLYVVENELVKHDPLKHVAVQILEFSLSFENSPQKIKAFIKSIWPLRSQTVPIVITKISLSNNSASSKTG